MKSSFFAAVCALSLLLSVSARAEDAVPPEDEDAGKDVFQDLCTDGKAEGGYVAQLGKLGTFNIYIVCTRPDYIVATMTGGVRGTGVPVTMEFPAIDDDEITFVTFNPNVKDAPTVSPGIGDTRLTLKIEALKNGTLDGSFTALHMVNEIPVSAKRSTEFPNLLKEADPTVDIHKSFRGLFAVSDLKDLKIKFKDPTLRLKIIKGMQRIDLNDSNVLNIAMVNGMVARSAGNIFYATTGWDDGDGGHGPLSHVRGRFVDADNIEFYYISSTTGLYPALLHATRRTVAVEVDTPPDLDVLPTPSSTANVSVAPKKTKAVPVPVRAKSTPAGRAAVQPRA